MAGKSSIILMIGMLAVLGMSTGGQAEDFYVDNVWALSLAFGDAEVNSQDDTIYIAPGVYDLNFLDISPEGARLHYIPVGEENYSLTIQGAGAGWTILWPGLTDTGYIDVLKLLKIDTTGLSNDTYANIIIRGITFKKGEPPTTVQTKFAEITVEDCEFVDNYDLRTINGGEGGGAKLTSEHGLITLRNNTFFDNGSASGGTCGGACIEADHGIITITNNTFCGNKSGSLGSGISIQSDDAMIFITNNWFTSNHSGGGAYVAFGDGTLSMNNNTFFSNSGVGLKIDAIGDNSSVYLAHNTFSNNHGGYCTAVDLTGKTVTLTNNIFSGNTASYYGGGCVSGNPLTLENNFFDNNQGGGVIGDSDNETLTLKGNTFTNNSSSDKDVEGIGAHIRSNSGPIIVQDNIFRNNNISIYDGMAEIKGGGIFINNTLGSIEVINNVFTGNILDDPIAATQGGGAYIYAEHGPITIYNNTFSGNSSFAGGGAYVRLWDYETEYPIINVISNIIWGNSAVFDPDLTVAIDHDGSPTFTPVSVLYNDFYNTLPSGSPEWYYIEDNIDEDPLLSPTSHLQAGSPCIDTGREWGNLPPTDFEGDVRIFDGNGDGEAIVDIGADEYISSTGFFRPVVTIHNLSLLIPRSLSMWNGTFEKGTMTFWFQEENDQMPRPWGVRLFDRAVDPGEKISFAFDWPRNGIRPSKNAKIFWSFETAIRTQNGEIVRIYPVYGFPAGTQSPEKPTVPQLMEVEREAGMISQFPIFGFASPGTLVGNAEFKVIFSETEEISVYIDIKPGSCPNPINVKSQGVLPVAVLGTKDLDIQTLDPATIRLSREGVKDGVSPIRWNYQDVATPFEGDLCGCHNLNGDGYMDLSLKFNTKELVDKLKLNEITGNTIHLILNGALKQEEGGIFIKGEDCVRILK